MYNYIILEFYLFMKIYFLKIILWNIGQPLFFWRKDSTSWCKATKVAWCCSCKNFIFCSNCAILSIFIVWCLILWFNPSFLSVNVIISDGDFFP